MEGDITGQAQHIWAMLEDMAQSDPAAYRNFIDKHMKEGQEFMKPPEPCICVQVSNRDKKTDRNTLLYLNICKWPRIAAPKSESDPIPIGGGSLYNIKDEKDDGAQVIAVAFNPEVLDQCLENAGHQEEQHLLINLCLEYVRKQYGLNVASSYTVLPNKTKHKGSYDQLKTSFTSKTKESDARLESELEGVLGPTMTNSLLNEMSNITLNDNKTESREPSYSVSTDGIKLPFEKKPAAKTLIEELNPSAGNSPGLPEPAYSLTVKEADERGDRRLLLRIQLPDVSSIAECELDISMDDVHLLVAGRYNLALRLPEAIDSDQSSAKWNSKKGTLSVTLPTTAST